MKIGLKNQNTIMKIGLKNQNTIRALFLNRVQE